MTVWSTSPATPGRPGRTLRQGDCRSGSRSTRSTSRRTTRRPPTSRRRCTSSTTSGPTSTRPPTTAGPCRRASPALPTVASTHADGGASGRLYQSTPPAVPVTDLTIKNGDLVVATQGRAFWVLDDLTPLRLWNDRTAEVDAHLFPTRPSHRVQTEKPDEDDPPKGVGANMPNGVLVHYWLREKPGKDKIVRIEILSGEKVIRSFSSEKKEPEGDLKEQAEKKELEKDRDKPLEPKAGVNRFLWDMRVFKPTLAPRAVFNEGDKSPPKVGPGTYQVRLTVGGKSFTETAEVKPHPQGVAAAEDLKAQFDLLAAIRDRLSETHEMVLKVRAARAQAKELGERAERLGKGDGLKKRAGALAEKLTAVELELTNPEIKADEDDLNYEPKLDHDWVNLAGIVASAARTEA